MPNLEKLKEIALHNILEYEEFFQYFEDPKLIKKYIDEFLRVTQKRDKSDLGRIDNFTIFFMLFYIFNQQINLNGEVKNFNELLTFASQFKDAINDWSHEDSGNFIYFLYSHINDDGSLKVSNQSIIEKDISNDEDKTSEEDYIRVLENIGLSKEILQYKNLKTIYSVMYYLLGLKYQIITMKTDKKYKMYKREETQKAMQILYADNPLSKYPDIIKRHFDKQVKKYNEAEELYQNGLKYTRIIIEQILDGSILTLRYLPDEFHRYLKSDILKEIYIIIEENLRSDKAHLDKYEQDYTNIVYQSSLTKYLFEAGYNPYTLDEKVLNNLEELFHKQDIIGNIEFLQLLDIPLSDILINYQNVLLTLDSNKTTILKSLINLKAISKTTLKIYIKDIGSIYNELLANYKILKPIIDFNSHFYNDSILFKPTTYLRNVLSVLAEYNLSESNYIFLLCNFNFINIYDLMLEKSLPIYLFISICRTPNPLNTIKRILIYEEIGEEYKTETNTLKRDVVYEDRFPVKDYDLDEYLPNFLTCIPLNNIDGNLINSVKESSFVKVLDEKYRSKDYYIIGNVYISRPKFLRKFESCGKDESQIISCLLSGSVINEKEYFDFTHELKEITLKK